MPENVLAKIKELEGLGVKPKDINPNLAENGMDPVDGKWLKRHLQQLRESKRGDVQVTKITLRQLKNWCIKNSKIPDKEDDVFVAKYEISALPKHMFRLFLTTKRLIAFATYNQHSLAGTFKRPNNFLNK